MTPKFTVTNIVATTPTPKSVIKRLPNQQSKSIGGANLGINVLSGFAAVLGIGLIMLSRLPVRLADNEIAAVVNDLVEDGAPVSEIDIAAIIMLITDHLPHPADTGRIRGQLQLFGVVVYDDFRRSD